MTTPMPEQTTKWIEAAYGLYLLEAGDGEVLESIKTSAYDGTATVAGSKKQYTTLAAAKSAVQANIAQNIESNLWTIKEWAYLHLGAMHNITISANSAHAIAAIASQKAAPQGKI